MPHQFHVHIDAVAADPEAVRWVELVELAEFDHPIVHPHQCVVPAQRERQGRDFLCKEFVQNRCRNTHPTPMGMRGQLSLEYTML